MRQVKESYRRIGDPDDRFDLDFLAIAGSPGYFRGGSGNDFGIYDSGVRTY